MKICLIITTYNWPQALELCLKSVVKQSKMPDEVIIADDGSREETRAMIERYKAKIPNLIHVWHEDNGYQRAKIINKAIDTATADFIITTDQDCILHKHYILDYSLQAEQGCYISAYRVNLMETLTKVLLKQRRLPNFLELLTQTKWNFKHQHRNTGKWNEKTRYITDTSDGTFGCNMAFFRQDAVDVNGYNEDFIGWGPEDSEFTQRLLNTGKKWKRIYYSAILYHLYHPVICRANLGPNQSLVDKARSEKRTVVKNGIKKLN